MRSDKTDAEPEALTPQSKRGTGRSKAPPGSGERVTENARARNPGPSTSAAPSSAGVSSAKSPAGIGFYQPMNENL